MRVRKRQFIESREHKFNNMWVIFNVKNKNMKNLSMFFYLFTEKFNYFIDKTKTFENIDNGSSIMIMITDFHYR